MSKHSESNSKTPTYILTNDVSLKSNWNRPSRTCRMRSRLSVCAKMRPGLRLSRKKSCVRSWSKRFRPPVTTRRQHVLPPSRLKPRGSVRSRMPKPLRLP